ncbi:unnamed protein product [Leptidea sinapis]|uniref:Cilia- and flagella-associated protein 299 n=1 Tax=Leptidea sinapis TaxID=189913 RepID=A0A5E4PUM9_9NEOP|nr:unnamed protein product [Leptidea sinapis]
MAEKKNEYPPSVEAYRRLLQFNTWEDYLDSLIEISDLRNLRSISIIFIRNFTKGGFEISGYIDYAHRLITENWAQFFKGNKTLWPRDSDLGYYHWRHGTVRSNISRNYKPVMDPDRGLLFQNRHDHKIVCPDPQQDPGQNTTKQRIYSPRYSQIEIYDHIVRRKS